jgi:triosephosphate isomerase
MSLRPPPNLQAEAVDLARDIADSITDDSPGDVALFVPFPYLETVQSVVGDKLIVGAEMVTPEMKGAFTGGVSPCMLKSMGIEWSLAGHSERRTLNGESDEYINAQCKILVENGMNVVLCIGETLEEFEKSLVDAVCEVQLKKGLEGIGAEQMSSVVIAYEPVWAIGTGKVATPEIAQSVHKSIRQILDKMYGSEVADSTKILYGGSVSADSVDGLLAQPDIDGGLVGGASLDATSFGRIINFEFADVLA